MSEYERLHKQYGQFTPEARSLRMMDRILDTQTAKIYDWKRYQTKQGLSERTVEVRTPLEQLDQMRTHEIRERTKKLEREKQQMLGEMRTLETEMAAINEMLEHMKKIKKSTRKIKKKIRKKKTNKK
ncbi:hypothetical protein K8R43_02095 [archaeon]|nr:hypothetical protein [archaeon]